MAKTMTIQVLDNTITFDNQQEGENNATTLTVDFTGCGVDNFVKWVDFRASDETATAVELGTGIIETIAIPNSLTKQGVLEIQAYAKDGTTVYMGKVFRVQVKRSLNVVGDTTEYDIGVVEALQNSVSNMQIQVETIWEAYNTGEFDGEDGLDGVSVNSIAFVGNDLVFTMSDLTTRTLIGAKLDLKGEVGATGATGADGEDGKTIVSASFVGNDLVFVNNDSSTVTLLNAKLSLKGDQGIQGISGISAYQVALNNGFVGTESEWLLSIKGEKGDTGSIADLGGVIAGLTEKTTPVDADKFVISDSADTNHEKKLFWSNIKATLKTYFDTLYNNYVHPSNHEPSIITQDSSNRFVTDAEKTAWNAKQPTLVSGTNIKTINGNSVLGSGDLVINSGSKENLIINGNFSVNQRAKTGTVVLTAGQYGHDRFKAGAGGCTYTFATSNNITTLTISAGSLIQVVEGLNLESGDVCLSWIGTAQGKIGAGSYGASGIVGTAIGGTNLNIEFNSGTLSKVSLVQGNSPQDFILKSYVDELRDCQRYFHAIASLSDSSYVKIGTGSAYDTSTVVIIYRLPVKMCKSPTMIVNDATKFWCTDGVTNLTLTNLTFETNGLDTVILKPIKTTSFTQFRLYLFERAGNQLGYIWADAEL